jgi:hypothetical protein
MMSNKQQKFPGQQPPVEKKAPSNEDKQGVDKAPGEEKEQGDQVTDKDLKGKKVDRDITDPKDEPAQ